MTWLQDTQFNQYFRQRSDFVYALNAKYLGNLTYIKLGQPSTVWAWQWLVV